MSANQRDRRSVSFNELLGPGKTLRTGASVSDGPREILIFEVDQQRFGLPAAIVQEIVRAVTIVALPQALVGIEGVVNFRGHVVPVLNLRRRLGWPAKSVEPSDHLIFARFQNSLVALRVDRVIELLALNTTNVLADGETPGGGKALNRVADLGGQLVPIIDLKGLLEPSERDAIDLLIHGVTPPAAQGLRP